MWTHTSPLSVHTTLLLPLLRLRSARCSAPPQKHAYKLLWQLPWQARILPQDACGQQHAQQIWLEMPTCDHRFSSTYHHLPALHA
jgi:hypothetical protein